MRSYLVLACLAASCSGPKDSGSDSAPGPTDTESPANQDTGVESNWPDIELDPVAADFGEVQSGCSSDPHTITIASVGAADLIVESATLDDTGAYGVQGFDSVVSLAPGETLDLQVVFSPSADLALETVLRINSNDPDEPMVSVELTGEMASALQVDSMVQTTHEELDLLLVLDNSGSMAEVAGLLFSDIAELFDPLDGVDLHLGLITTDMDDPSYSGRMIGGYIDSSATDMATELQARIPDEFTGSGDERGLDAIEAALTEPLLSTHNAGFLREDAAFAAVVFTDEDDDSSLDAASFATWLESLEADAANASFSGFIGDPGGSGCFLVEGDTVVSAISGDKYDEAIQATGGSWWTICASDFTEALLELGTEVSGAQDCFTLSDTPLDGAASFEYVQVDGEDISYGTLDGWTWDESQACLRLNGDSMPDPGSVIEVAYETASDCP